ncbi:MAG: DUF2804 domain-containing protein [Sphingobacteriales bacterium]|nr:DUF2804 domain-containing protein [Sphingobacteriales bacterium]
MAKKGWAKNLLLNYKRSDIKASPLRIKEWDYYCILQKDYGIALTVADNSYMALYAINVYDFTTNKEITDMVMVPFTMGKLHMPEHSAHGDTVVNHKKVQMHFTHKNGKRVLDFNFPEFNKGKGIKGHIELEALNKDSMVIATPWKEDKLAFYYNQKINCLAANGEFCFWWKGIYV